MTIATTVESAEARFSSIRGASVITIIGRGILVFFAVWLVLNLVKDPSRFLASVFNGVGNGTLYALIALGYTLVYGIIELINFAHGDLFMLGSVFSTFVAIRWFGVDSPSVRNTIMLIVALVIVMAMCAGINVLIERLAYRRLRRAPKLAALITAVGVSFIFQFFGLRLNGSQQVPWPSAIPSGGIEIFGATLRWTTVMLVVVTVPLLVGLSYIVNRTRQGRAMRATAQDQDAALLMGININRTIAFTFGLGGAMAGAAGVLYVQNGGATRFDLGFQLGLIAFTSAVLGGIGSLSGAVVGGLIIGMIQSFNDGLPFGLGQQWSQTVVFSILIMLMVFKPEGILGKPTIEKV